MTMTAPGRSVFEVSDPATGEAVESAPECTRADLDGAMAAADAAFVGWSRDLPARRAGLQALAECLLANQDELARLTTLEQGKPLGEAIVEVIGASMILSYSAGLELPVETIHEGPDARVEVRRKAIGPVVAITPWNAPLYMLAMKLGPALAAGNTVVAKPSPVTPLATARFGELARDLLPAGVFAVVTGSGALGEWMVSHPLTRKITFTGSVATGRRVAAAAAADLKRVTLELGGNDPAIVLADADLERASVGLARMAFGNAGQVCVAPKRIYAHASVYDELVERLAALASEIQVGPGLEAGVEMGPLTTPEQRDYVEGLLADAVAGGARIETGGTRVGEQGWFLAPTVVSHIRDEARLVAEEQFGPAIPVLSYTDVDEAVRRANHTLYGLGASVWGSDAAALADVGGRLEAGQVWVNAHREVATPAQPVVGVKSSGLGAENGALGLLDFTDAQMFYEAKASPS